MYLYYLSIQIKVNQLQNWVKNGKIRVRKEKLIQKWSLSSVVERFVHIEEVIGSSPIATTTSKGERITGKTHQIIGGTAGLTYFLSAAPPTYSPATFGAVLVFAYIAALLPDIDQPTGKLWHYLPFGDTVGRLSDPFLEHRNITHSFLGVTLVGIGFYYLFKIFPSYWGIDTNIVFIAAIISYLSHLLADMFTVQGIPLFFPYQKFFGLPPKPLHGFRIVTGKWFENLVIFPAVTVYLIILVLARFDDIKKILLR